MSTKEARGTKRTCQSSDCGERFYDLNRDPIICPICQSVYVIASAPLTASLKPEPSSPKAADANLDEDDIEIDDATESLEDLAEAEEAVAGDDDDTFLEEEEDSGDVSGIIGSVQEGEDET
ncbi:MAG: hypothetical protein RLZ98_955 [Pseudomonadota bacterium]